MTTLSAILLALLGGAVLGVGGTVGIMHATQPQDAPAAVLEAAPAIVDAARAPEATEAEARLAVASAPAVNIAVEAAVRPDADARTVALAGYLGCMAASQAQAQGAAAYDCAARGKMLDALLSQ